MQATHEARVRETQFQPNIRTSPSVVKRRKRSIGDLISVAACLVVCLAAFWFVANKGGRIDQLNDDIFQLQTQIKTVNAQNASLTAQVDSLTRPTRILNIALNELHMKYATPIQINVSSAGNAK